MDLRPLTALMAVEVVTATCAIWTKEVDSCSTREDLAAADAAIQQALSNEWFAFDRNLAFDFEIYCDTAAELSDYVRTRKLREDEIPYEDLEARRREAGARGPTARLRCRRPWMLSTYAARPNR